MRAMQYRNAGGPDQIVAVEVPTPRPAATQLLVKVAASSVNPVDWGKPGSVGQTRVREEFFLI